MAISSKKGKAPLVILAVTDRYPIGELEEQVFATAKHTSPYNLITIPLDIKLPLQSIPENVTRQVDGLFLLRHRFGKTSVKDIPRFPKLKCIVRTGVGYDSVDREAIASAGITLHNVPDYGTAEIADHAIALALSLRRGIVLHHDEQRTIAPAWSPLDGPKHWTGKNGQLIQRSTGRIWGIVGLGRIGTAVALRAKALDYNVVFHDPLLPNGVDKALGIKRCSRLRELLSTSDVISLHCTLTPDTHHLISRQNLVLVKQDAVLINVARGEVVDLESLYDSLKEDRLAAVGLDVVETEPPTEPLPSLIKAYRAREAWLAGRMILTPHVAFYSKESVAEMRLKSAETMRDVLFDGLNTNAIPPPSIR